MSDIIDHPYVSQKENVQLYDCPGCGFRFDAVHVNEGGPYSGHYSCPVCEEATLRARLAAAEKVIEAAQNKAIHAVLRDYILKHPKSNIKYAKFVKAIEDYTGKPIKIAFLGGQDALATYQEHSDGH